MEPSPNLIRTLFFFALAERTGSDRRRIIRALAETKFSSNGPFPLVSRKTLDERIESRPGVLGGKPCIAGQRIAVEHIAVWHERLGMSANEIAGEYDLDLTDVYAALAYYFAHREEIDRSIREGKEAVRQLHKQSPSLVEGSSGGASPI